MNNFPKAILDEARNNGFDKVTFCTESNGYKYYRFNSSNRPRYTGHPIVIKLKLNGTIEQVLDIDEIYWATDFTKDEISL